MTTGPTRYATWPEVTTAHGTRLRWSAALGLAALLLGIWPARLTAQPAAALRTPTGPSAQGAPPAQTSPPPSPSGRSFTKPAWLELHAEQRTRYETLNHRYRPTEVGSDQQLAFRTRLQVRVGTKRLWAYSETQDSRVALDDSGSTVNATMEWNTKVLQLHAGAAWSNLGRHRLSAQVEVGRFSRDYGFRRVIARNLYRNTTNAWDGVTARVGGRGWAVTALATRPVYYTYPALVRDARFEHLRFGGLYGTLTRRPAAQADLYALVWRDGRAMPVTVRRSIDTVGGRLFGTFGPDRRAEYELEGAGQWGTVGPRDHAAWFAHAQAGYNWPATVWKPRLLALWDQASGDRDPRDGRSSGWDALLGARRFEFGPVGLYGLIGRTNLRSVAAWGFVRPSAAWDASLQVRGVWLDQARDAWRPSGLVDATGRAGTHVGSQAELRVRHRIGRYLELDGGLVLFEEGRFVRTLKPSPEGRALFAYFATDWKF